MSSETRPNHQHELRRRANNGEFQFADEHIVKDVITLIMDQAGTARKKDVEIEYSYPLSRFERQAIKENLQKSHGNFSKRVYFMSSEDSQGPITIVQIQKKKGR